MKTRTAHAAAASSVRRELKAAYPTVAFRVTSKSYSGGSSVSVRWTDGPTSGQVSAIANKYQMGSFDGMRDLYEYTNRRDDIPQVRHVLTHRDTSRDAYAAAIALVNRSWGWELVIHPEYNGVTPDSNGMRPNHGGPQSHEINRTLHDLSLLCPGCHAATLPGDAFCPACGASLAPEAVAA